MEAVMMGMGAMREALYFMIRMAVIPGNFQGQEIPTSWMNTSKAGPSVIISIINVGRAVTY
jgi:hypothetical protein